MAFPNMKHYLLILSKKSNYNQEEWILLYNWIKASKTIELATKEKSFNNLSLNLQQENLCRTEFSDGSNVYFKQYGEMFQQIDLQW